MELDKTPEGPERGTMSFLDNLENNLKALESREESDPDKRKRDQERRETERAEELARAPYVEALKNSRFTSELLTQCRVIGHQQRVLVRFTWIGDRLRLDATPRRLELVPIAEGIEAVFSRGGVENRRTAVNLETDDPSALARDWLAESD